jgi:hypothetical protein
MIKIMKKLNLSILIVTLILAVAGAANAGMLIPASEQAKEKAQAPEKSPVISETPGGDWDLERVDFIHYVKPTNPSKGAKSGTCYKLMGVKWNSLPVNYVINPNNNDGLSTDFVANAISLSAETWDNETSSELFNDLYAIDETAQYGIQDFRNVVAFGNYSNDNVIAVTSVWFTRRGKQIVEFDMLFNDHYLWGDAATASGTPAVMDLENIATHELGHSVGLDDIYLSSCSNVTMYGYSSEGEISKRTLEQPDITGLRSLYGL